MLPIRKNFVRVNRTVYTDSPKSINNDINILPLEQSHSETDLGHY